MTSRSIHRDALAIGLATGVYAVSYGVLAVAAGLSVAQTCSMSLLVFTGASQFALIGVLGAGGGLTGARARACCSPGATPLRHCPVAPSSRGPLSRALQSQLIIDESTAMARAQPERAPPRAFLATGLSVFVFWNLGTLAGALVGGGLGDPQALGLDAMFPAAFLALLAPQLRRPARAPRRSPGRSRRRARPVRPRRRPDPRCCPRRPPGDARATAVRAVIWIAILGFAAAAFALKALGPIILGRRPLRPGTRRSRADPGAAHRRARARADARRRRAAGDRRARPRAGVAALLVWRRAPFLVVVVAAAATAALLRAAG